MDIKQLKKGSNSKADAMTAARIPQSTLDVLKKNNINVSMAIREYLIDLAAQITKRRLKRAA